ncbi:MAG TPA: hypothetical protein DHW73_06990 [Pseudomonas sp.]|nr:hypothetical protein [Pseudomonadales bacterium]HCL41105.1 hypothetical protein [Pseudomonas sp.]|tara:strand:+ start:2821 stop:3462 length:642 start_codon:yes stop_codon:yes gene_type:complete
MELFFQTSLTFPVVLFSFMLCVAMLYWLTVALGAVDVDVLDAGGDGGMDDPSNAEGLGGLLMKLGLHDVPVTLVLTVLVFFAWLASYFTQLLLLGWLPLGLLRFPLGLVVIVLALAVAVPVTRLVVAPLRPLFRKALGSTTRSLLGQVVVVRSPLVSDRLGEAVMEDGGAGLILRVRADPALGFKRGDRLVLLEYLEAEHAYRVIGEDEFNGK